jgi:hypothetical protein
VISTGVNQRWGQYGAGVHRHSSALRVVAPRLRGCGPVTWRVASMPATAAANQKVAGRAGDHHRAHPQRRDLAVSHEPTT